YARSPPRSLQRQNGGAAHPAAGQVGQRLVSLVEGVGGGGDLDPETLGQGEEVGGVAPGVGRDAAQRPLLEQVAGVVQGRDVGQVDARDRQRAAPAERGERRWHHVTDRGED